MSRYLNRNPSGYLRSLRRRSYARDYCRNVIRSMSGLGGIDSIMDVGFGGGNERIMLHDLFVARPELRFIGVDSRPECVKLGRFRWPEHTWRVGNLDMPQDGIFADVVYCQHVLEHCADLQPGLDWLLQCTNKVLLVIFFIPLGGIPVYGKRRRIHANQYSRPQVADSCVRARFNCEFHDFDNRDRINGRHGVRFETVLQAERK